MTKQNRFHENFNPDDEISIGSPRTFGFVFALVFAVISLWPLVDGHPVRNWSACVSGFLIVIVLVAPKLLQPLNKLWFWIGICLHKLMSPVVMGFLFFSTVMPIAIILRLIGKDPLNKKMDPSQESYWIKRRPDELSPESMKNQF